MFAGFAFSRRASPLLSMLIQHKKLLWCFLQVNARRRTDAEHKLHRRLRIMGGAQAGKRILSGRGETTRPMMEKVCFDHRAGSLAGSACYLCCALDVKCLQHDGNHLITSCCVPGEEGPL